MDPSNPEIAYEIASFFRAYKDGRVERFLDTDIFPASIDSVTGVSSKDVQVLPELGVSARLFLPKLDDPSTKLPLLIYFHGGAFCLCSPFCARYHNYVNTLVAASKVVVVAVDYRKAPEHPIPAAYDDSWAAVQWAASHRNGDGPEAWLNDHVDYSRVFLSGESAGANIVHNLAMRAGQPDSKLGLDILGVGLMHPFFWGSVPVGSEHLSLEERKSVDSLWPFVCPDMPDNDDPRVNPIAEGAPSLAGLGCRRMLVCVAEKDVLRERGRVYYEELGRSGWKGAAEFTETEGEGHGFHLYDLGSDKAKRVITSLTAFFNLY